MIWVESEAWIDSEAWVDSAVTTVVERETMRSVGDSQPLVFNWANLGATLTGTRAIGLEAPVAIPSNRLQFLRNEGVEDAHYLDYHPDDRPANAGAVRYRITDGAITLKLLLNVIDITGTNGLFSATINVVDNLGGLIADTLVNIRDAAQTRTIGWGRTNSSGAIVFYLNAGTYKVIVQSPAGYSTLAVQTLVVSGDGPVTYTLSILPPSSSGTTTPVAADGTVQPIVIGDDYLDANNRTFDFFVPPVAGVDINTVQCWFGGEFKHRGKWLVSGTVALVVDRWRMRFELPAAATFPTCKSGCYDYSAELRTAAGKRLTRLLGSVELVDSFTR